MHFMDKVDGTGQVGAGVCSQDGQRVGDDVPARCVPRQVQPYLAGMPGDPPGGAEQSEPKSFGLPPAAAGACLYDRVS